eukprot:comp7256_c0_seq1/m.2963 comp7256_c0_seq1/g.2963  ORF comp7256_c0_seq1/g.2963 comp7256_c0_seq1/m.2963 type:complete len:275 (-) comp7256_c0_seq1:309-1133(-)
MAGYDGIRKLPRCTNCKKLQPPFTNCGTHQFPSYGMPSSFYQWPYNGYYGDQYASYYQNYGNPYHPYYHPSQFGNYQTPSYPVNESTRQTPPTQNSPEFHSTNANFKPQSQGEHSSHQNPNTTISQEYYEGKTSDQAAGKEIYRRTTSHNLKTSQSETTAGRVGREKENEKRAQDDLKMELTPEMVEFLRNSSARKRKKEEDARLAKEEAARELASQPKPQAAIDLRRSRQRELYGEEGARLVSQLEGTLDLDYDTYADTHRPPLWPNLPLRLC